MFTYQMTLLDSKYTVFDVTVQTTLKALITNNTVSVEQNFQIVLYAPMNVTYVY